jgi:xanthine dehydrogenase accessory factor
VRQEESGVLLSIMAPDKLPRKILLEDVEQSEATANIEFAPAVLAAMARVVAAGCSGEKVETGDFDVFIESLAPPPTVVIFGAGHLAQHIARCARAVHFKVTVCDDREAYANRAQFPDADEVLVADFADVLDRVRIDSNTYVVIVTRGHACDQIVLEQVLKTPAPYVGMIGSKRKTQTILDNLRGKGFTEAMLARICAPIGLAIGAVTPEEIALSIVCELVKVRRLGRESPVEHLTLMRAGGRT